MPRLRPRHPNAQARAARREDAFELLAVVGEDPLQLPAGLPAAGTHDLPQERQHRGRRHLPDHQPGPRERRRDVTAGELRHLAHALQLAYVERMAATPGRPVRSAST